MSAVERLLNSNVREILSSPELILLMLRTYSNLYANGKAVATCERSINNYYNQLKIDGMTKERIAELAKNRTLEPNWNGLLYISGGINKHISSQTINDKDAILYLKSGVLTEKMFKKLPDGYKAKSEETEATKAPKTRKKRTPKTDK